MWSEVDDCARPHIVCPNQHSCSQGCAGGHERDVEAAQTYEAMAAIELRAEALRTFFAHVEEVRQQAERVKILARHRIGEELGRIKETRGGDRRQKQQPVTFAPTQKALLWVDYAGVQAQAPGAHSDRYR